MHRYIGKYLSKYLRIADGRRRIRRLWWGVCGIGAFLGGGERGWLLGRVGINHEVLKTSITRGKWEVHEGFDVDM